MWLSDRELDVDLLCVFAELADKRHRRRLGRRLRRRGCCAVDPSSNPSNPSIQSYLTFKHATSLTTPRYKSCSPHITTSRISHRQHRAIAGEHVIRAAHCAAQRAIRSFVASRRRSPRYMRCYTEASEVSH